MPRGRSPSPKKSPKSPKTPKRTPSPRPRGRPPKTPRAVSPAPKGAEGANFSEAMGAGSLMPAFLVAVCPPTASVVAFITNGTLPAPTLTAFIAWGNKVGWSQALMTIFKAGGAGTIQGWLFLLVWVLVARVLYDVPAKIETGPLTATGHTPKYKANGMWHCVLSTAVFLIGSL